MIDLENRYTLLHRLVEDLDQVLVAQGRQIESLERKNGLLSNQLRSLSEREVEPRSLEDDKPPHY